MAMRVGEGRGKLLQISRVFLLMEKNSSSMAETGVHGRLLRQPGNDDGLRRKYQPGFLAIVPDS